MSRIPDRLAFLGGGIIAEVFIDRLLSTGAMQPGNILATDIRPERLAELSGRWGICTSVKNTDAVELADWLILAVPPPAALPVLKEIRPLRAEHRVVSLAAAVPMPALQSAAAPAGVVRVMPNAPSLVGEAMNLVAFPGNTQAADRGQVKALLGIFGRWQEVPDPAMTHGPRCAPSDPRTCCRCSTHWRPPQQPMAFPVSKPWPPRPNWPSGRAG